MTILRPIVRPIMRPIMRSPFEAAMGDALTAAVKAMFASGEKGVMFDLSRASNLYTDSARTTLVTASGDRIGSVTDLSPNGKHASSSGTARPFFRGSYGEWDGFDDYMQTSAIDLSATDKVTVVASFRKSSDALRQLLLEFSATIATAGTFSIEAPSAGGSTRIDAFQKGATTSRAATAIGASYAAPLTCVATLIGDLNSPNIGININGTSVATNTGATGGGNFSSNALNIGARNAGASLWLTGYVYRLLVIGRALTTTERNAAERWAAQPAGVTIA